MAWRSDWTPWVLAAVFLSISILLFIAIRRVSDEYVSSSSEIKTAAMSTVDALSKQIGVQRNRIDTLEVELDVALKLIRLQTDVLWSLDNLVLSDDVPLACKNMVKMILTENANLLDKVIFRCYILRPDGNYLKPYISQQMPEPDGYERKFYIGDDPAIRRGVAGAAYMNGSIEVTHRVDEDDKHEGVIFDHPEFIPLDTTLPAPQYRSIICVPVRPDRDRYLGVLCLDSEDPTVFDDETQQQYLSALGVLIGFVLSVSDIAEQKRERSNRLPLLDETRRVDEEPSKGDIT